MIFRSHPDRADVLDPRIGPSNFVQPSDPALMSSKHRTSKHTLGESSTHSAKCFVLLNFTECAICKLGRRVILAERSLFRG
jgi:hypothetical protein